MDFPRLDCLTEDEARSLVVGLVKDAEQKLITALFNRQINAGPAGDNFDRDAEKIRNGLARIKGNPAWARYLVPPPAAVPEGAAPALVP